jgi:hypothetical protein
MVRRCLGFFLTHSEVHQIYAMTCLHAPVRTSMPELEEKSANAAVMLRSWKEIAAYLGRGVRTVQRWHSELQLPVHSSTPNSRAHVFAYKAELDEWLRERARDMAVQHEPVGEDHRGNPRLVRSRAATAKALALISTQHDQVTRITDTVRRIVDRMKSRERAPSTLKTRGISPPGKSG